MSAAHTPGPWTFKRGVYRIEVRTTPERSYAFSMSDESNARLIASAPELLASLELALATIGGQAELLRNCGAAYGIGATLKRATEAIAKAKGGAA